MIKRCCLWNRDVPVAGFVPFASRVLVGCHFQR